MFFIRLVKFFRSLLTDGIFREKKNMESFSY